MKTQSKLFAVACFVSLLFYRCTDSSSVTLANADTSATKQNFAGYASQVDWGQHLVTTLGCGDCHTPKKITDHGPIDDSSLLLSGHPSQMPAPQLTSDQLAHGLAATTANTGWVGPWGHSYSANLTSDSTGIGSWTNEQFKNAIRKSLYKGLENSRPIMPPMPVNSYKNLTDDEISAIFAYLKSIKPIHNIVPEYQPPVAMK